MGSQELLGDSKPLILVSQQLPGNSYHQSPLAKCVNGFTAASWRSRTIHNGFAAAAWIFRNQKDFIRKVCKRHCSTFSDARSAETCGPTAASWRFRNHWYNIGFQHRLGNSKPSIFHRNSTPAILHLKNAQVASQQPPGNLKPSMAASQQLPGSTYLPPHTGFAGFVSWSRGHSVFLWGDVSKIVLNAETGNP